MPPALDTTDRNLITQLRRRPRVTVAELSRIIGVARGTVQSRMAKLEDRGVIRGYGPDVDPTAAGYDVRAFTTLAIAQGAHDHIVAELETIPEILEVHTVTGGGDMLLRIVARNNDHLHAVLQQVAGIAHVTRTETHLALASPVQRTVADLIAANAS